MADFLGGLLSGGGGLYDDLLTPQQRDQLSSRGLLSMAGAFADAAMPSRFPVPLGAALGKAAAAMGSGRDEAALSLLKAGMTAQEIKAMRQKMALNEQISPILLRMLGLSGTGGVPAAGIPAGATSTEPAAPAPAAPDTAPLPAAPAAPAGAMFAVPPIPSIYGNPPRQSLSPYTGLRPAATAAPPAQLPMPPAPPGGRITPADYGVPNPPSAGSAPLDSPPTAAERLEWNKTVGTGGLDIPLEDWVAQRRAGAPAGRPSAQPPDAPPGAGSSLNDRYGGVLALAGRLGDGASGSSLPPPDELIRQGSGPGGLLQVSYTGAPPFGPEGEIGSGGAYEDKRARDLALVEKYESGGRNIEQQVVGPQGGYNPSVGRVTGPSSASGYRQMIDSTWRSAAGMAGIDTRLYPRAIDAPRELQQLAAEALYDKRGLADWAPYNRALARAVGWSGPMGDGGGSGGGAAPGTLATPPGAGAALATPSGGVIPGTGMTAQQLGALNALTKMGGLGDPFNSLLETYYKSPAYLGEAATATERAQKGVALEYAAPIATAETKARLEQELLLKPLIEAKIEELKNGPLKDRAETQAQIDRYSDFLKQMTTARTTNTKVTVSVGGQPREITVSNAQATDLAAGKGIPELGIPPGAAVMMGTPVYTETEKAIGADAAKAFGLQRDAAQAAAQQVKINNESLRLLDSGLYTGWDANLALSMARIFGIQGKDTAEKVQNTQLFVLQRMQQAAEAVKAQPGSASDKDLAFANRMALGDISLEPSTIRQGMEIYNRFSLDKIREHNKNAAGIPSGVTSGIRQTVDEPPPYERNQGNTPGGNRWQRPPGQ